MDLDAYLAAHRGEWARLEQLLKRNPRQLTGPEVDELVTLYRRTATHLSVVQSASPDPVLVGKLSSLVAQGRSRVAGTRQAAWRDVARFLREDFPAVVYRCRWWWLASAAAFLLVAFAWGAYIATHPSAEAALVPPEHVQQLVEHDFADYYKQAPAQDFAFKVFTNNALIAAGEVATGILLLPVVYLLYTNAVSVGVVGGVMAAHDRSGLFFGLILPHGLLELTTVFVAAGLGLKLGWTVIDPGRRPRAQAIAEEGRALLIGAAGLALMLLISGVIEAFVTPSPLPTWARIGIGVLAEAAFLAVVFVLGRRAAGAGVTGDLADSGDTLPYAG
ncbi:MAG TPA: stage II sporulation protein M [Mycobacteriales bacterium]|nr:stage II sporulation protein M [Mycobacteriales bacterium]